MTETVCNYAILRFMPDRVRGEFMNLGIALHAPRDGWFGYRLLPDAGDRAKRVFPPLDPIAFESELEGQRRELDRIKALERDREGLAVAFRELVRPREGWFQFSDISTVLGPGPERSLAEAFQRRVA